MSPSVEVRSKRWTRLLFVLVVPMLGGLWYVQHRGQSDLRHQVRKQCLTSRAGRIDSNMNVRYPLREFMLAAARTRQEAADRAPGSLPPFARDSSEYVHPDAKAARRYRTLAGRVHPLPLLPCP